MNDNINQTDSLFDWHYKGKISFGNLRKLYQINQMITFPTITLSSYHCKFKTKRLAFFHLTFLRNFCNAMKHMWRKFLLSWIELEWKEENPTIDIWPNIVALKQTSRTKLVGGRNWLAFIFLLLPLKCLHTQMFLG